MTYDLELAGVGKTYPDGTPAVIDFDLRAAKGEFISFVGPSGCGKTTTLRMIAGFEDISAGDILVRGRRINDLPPERRPTSTIFQNFALFPHMTVRQNIEYGLRVKGLPAAERRAKADHMMQVLDLADIADRRSSGLSGGQRQRTALARGLVVEPDILLLDEPLGALDANLRKSIQAELKLLQRNIGITFVFVTHAQSEALALSDRIVVMNRGRVEQISPPEEVYRRPQTEFVARFIGRNTVLAGRLEARDGAVARVETGFGPLHGTLNDPTLKVGDAAAVVVPSEAIDVVGAAGAASLAGRGDTLPGRLIGQAVTGHALHLTIGLADGREIGVESHVDKYAAGWSGEEIVLGWQPGEATVIRAAA